MSATNWIRTFEPTGRFVGKSFVKTSVDFWLYDNETGRLWVIFNDGRQVKSDYDDLQQLFAGESVREIPPLYARKVSR